MYQLDSSYDWDSSVPSENKVVTLPLQKEKATADKPSGLALVKPRLSVVAELPDRDLIKAANTSVIPASEQQLGQLLSNLLKYGVFLASAIVLAGGVLYSIRHGAEPANYHVFRGEPDRFRFPTAVLAGALAGKSQSILPLGILVLIATPIARVATSLLFFLRQRNIPFAIVTFLVMAALVYGIVGAYC